MAVFVSFLKPLLLPPSHTHTQKGALAIEDEGVNPLGTFTINRLSGLN